MDDGREGEAAGPVLFHEEQAFRQAWLWILVAGAWIALVAGLGAGAYREVLRGSGLGAMLGIVLATGVVWLLLAARLVVAVTPGLLTVRFFPFHRRPREFPLETIARWEPRTYRPILEYGGWGIRLGLRAGWAYNVSGNRGVQLLFQGGKKILIGSQRSEELARALDEAAGQR